MKLSIIIPVFNEVNTIEKIINKIHSQSIKNFEIIVVDDFSTDGTRKILKSKLRNKVNKIIYHKKNKSQLDIRYHVGESFETIGLAQAVSWIDQASAFGIKRLGHARHPLAIQPP